MASPPITPRNRDFEDAADYRFKTNGTACEWGESYRPGGYHPVHPGGVLQDCYRIIRKLGYGSFSTTWLAVDQSSDCFIALKVTVASLDKQVIDQTLAIHKTLPQTGPQPLVGLRGVFELTGPNGRHACF
jgi:serine/threonine protein kinase